MLPYVAPLAWLIVGTFGAAAWVYASSDRVLERRTPEQRQQLRATFDGRVHILLTGAIGLLCLAATIRSIWIGHGAWWVWLLATVAQIGALLARERAAERYFTFVGERRSPRTQQERARQRHVLTYAAVGCLAFVAGELVKPDPEAAGGADIRTISAVILLALAVFAALGAGWSAVWVYKSDRTEDGI